MEGNQQQRKYNNGKRHELATKQKARDLREQGLTHREIAKKLGISLGSASLWTMGILLTSKQKVEIQQRRHVRHWSPGERQLLSKRLSPYQFQIRFTKEMLLKMIRKFYDLHGRIPLKREFNMERTYRRHFGSWNKAIQAAGYKPNPEFFAKKERARDGHTCDSFAEMLIDNWLFEHGIPHVRNRRYPGSKMTADFYIESRDTLIEYFGLRGVNKRYDRNLEKKQAIINREKLTLVVLFPEDLGSKTLPEKLGILLKTGSREV